MKNYSIPKLIAAIFTCLFLSAGPFLSLQAQEHEDHDDHAEESVPLEMQADPHDDHAEHDEHTDKSAHNEKDDDDHEDHAEEEGDHGGVIELSAIDIQDFGIEVQTAASGTIHEELRLQGEVKMNENRMGHVSPRFTGVVTSIEKRLGDLVKQGDVLATVESNDTLRPFQLIAPLDGTIVSFHITPGESLEPGVVAYTISDTSVIWVDLRVYQRDLPKVHQDQGVRISAGHEYPEAEGRLSYVGPVIDETTRTGLARVALPNPENTYRPGLFVIGNVLLDAHKLPVVVPRTAVIAYGDERVIFVESEDGHGFEKKAVIPGQGDSTHLAIKQGLSPGERYVSKGGFFLKADSQKEDFGDGHGH
ncbi:efflux RND transporter periplasmic adaptor subunit [Kiritimatiellota bacterium B12222]|nr:efflux RND transporter periplasmic adaptor subunit [Kiritimatiellota bacterium B12222]